MKNIDIEELFRQNKINLEKFAEELNIVMVVAVVKNRGEIVKLLIDAGANPNYKNNNEESLLVYAAKNNSDLAAKILLESGAVIDKKTDDFFYDKRPIAVSLDNNSFKVFKLLIEAYDESNEYESLNKMLIESLEKEYYEIAELLIRKIGKFKDKEEENKALIIASKKNNIEIAKLLIESGAKINSEKLADKTSLVIAAKNNSYDMVKLLLESGADPNSRCYDHALIEAINNNSKEIVLELIKYGADLEREYRGWAVPFTFACWKSPEIARLLIKLGVDIHILKPKGENGLSYALVNKNYELFDELLSLGVDINKQDKTGDSMLCAVSYNENKEKIKFLISRGIEIDIKNNEGETAITIAVKKSNIENIKLLIDGGADVNNVDNSGKSIMDYATEINNIDIINLLLKAGADIKKEDYWQNLMNAKYENREITTVLRSELEKDNSKRDTIEFLKKCTDNNEIELIREFINIKGHENIKFELADRKDDVMELLKKCIENNRAEIINLVLEFTGEIELGELLFKTCEKGFIESADVLIQNGANVNYVTKYDEIPLNGACLSGNIELVKRLLELGADIDNKVAERNGTTPQRPIYSAIYSNSIEIVKLLIDRNADVNLTTNGDTILMWTCEWGNGPCVEMLLNAGADVSGESSHEQNLLDILDNSNCKDEEMLGKIRELIVAKYEELGIEIDEDE